MLVKPHDHRRRAMVAVLVIAAAQLVAQAVTSMPAFAYGQLDIETVATTLDDYDDRHNSNSTQTRSATCPAGTHVIGGGARVSGGSDEVRLTRLVPAVLTVGRGRSG